MALWTALSRRRRKIPAINNPTAGLRLTQDLSNTKTTQTLGWYVWPKSWVKLKNYPNIGLICLTQELGKTKKLPKHWVDMSDPGAG